MQPTGTLYAHHYTWPECWELMSVKKTVMLDAGGWGININTHITENEAFAAWHKAVSFAKQGDKDVPQHVIDNHMSQTKPSKATPLAKISPPFTWSYTSLIAFENCPLSFAHQRYYKDVAFVETEALRDGNRQHKALELYAKGIKQPAAELECVRPHLKYVDAFRNAGGVLQAEREITLTDKLKPTTWFARDAWFRIKLDITILRGTAANLYDWKTGKQKEDMTQLKLCCGALAIVEPEVQDLTAKNIWLKTNTVDQGVKLTRADLRDVWGDTLGRVHRMKQAWDSEVWQPKPSGLCNYCGYQAKCKYKR